MINLGGCWQTSFAGVACRLRFSWHVERSRAALALAVFHPGGRRDTGCHRAGNRRQGHT